jgi:sugar/nucleoside kinase (ribokinase family)
VNKMRVVSIDGVFLEFVTDLDMVEHTAILSNLTDLTTPARIWTKAGGTAVEFAFAAKAAGFGSSTVVGKIGGHLDPKGTVTPDAAGLVVLDLVKISGVEALIAVDANCETGKTMISYFTDRRRLMISDPGANQAFSVSDISPEMIECVIGADLIHVSGYTLLHDLPRQALQYLLGQAKKGDAYVVIDVVPHSFYRYMTLDELFTHTRGLVDCAIIETEAAARLLQVTTPVEGSTESGLSELAIQRLRAGFSTVAISVSSGTYIVDTGTERFSFKSVETLPNGMRQLGYTARVQAELLQSLLVRRADR